MRQCGMYTTVFWASLGHKSMPKYFAPIFLLKRWVGVPTHLSEAQKYRLDASKIKPSIINWFDSFVWTVWTSLYLIIDIFLATSKTCFFNNCIIVNWFCYRTWYFAWYQSLIKSDSRLNRRGSKRWTNAKMWIQR